MEREVSSAQVNAVWIGRLACIWPEDPEKQNQTRRSEQTTADVLMCCRSLYHCKNTNIHQSLFIWFSINIINKNTFKLQITHWILTFCLFGNSMQCGMIKLIHMIQINVWEMCQIIQCIHKIHILEKHYIHKNIQSTDLYCHRVFKQDKTSWLCVYDNRILTCTLSSQKEPQTYVQPMSKTIWNTGRPSWHFLYDTQQYEWMCVCAVNSPVIHDRVMIVN